MRLSFVYVFFYIYKSTYMSDTNKSHCSFFRQRDTQTQNSWTLSQKWR